MPNETKRDKDQFQSLLNRNLRKGPSNTKSDAMRIPLIWRNLWRPN